MDKPKVRGDSSILDVLVKKHETPRLILSTFLFLPYFSIMIHTYESDKIPFTTRNIEFVEQSYLISRPFSIYGPTISVIQLSNLSTWAFPVFYKNILDWGITPDVWLIKVHTYITFESTESMLSFEMTLAQQRLGDHPIHLDIHFGQYFHLKILLGAIK